MSFSLNKADYPGRPGVPSGIGWSSEMDALVIVADVVFEEIGRILMVDIPEVAGRRMNTPTVL
jgi:hypothetical protein